MESVSLNLPETTNILHRHVILEEKLNNLEDKIESLMNEEDSPMTRRKINVKKFIENYKLEKKLKEKEDKERALFNELLGKVEESKEKVKYQEIMKKKQMAKKSVNLDDIQSHDAKYRELKHRLAAEKEIERFRRNEEIRNSNEILSTSFDYTKRKLEQFEKKQKEMIEKEMIEKAVVNLNKKEYAKIISESFKPEIKSNRKVNFPDNSLVQEKVTLKPRKNKSIKMIKMTDKRKYNWELKLDKLNDYDLSKSSSLPRKGKKSPSPTVIKSPLSKKPDYLTESRIKKAKSPSSNNSFNRKKDKKWEKMLNKDDQSGDNSIIFNIENVKKEAEYLESKAKRNEYLIRNNGGVKKNPETSEKTAELLVDSIKAKLAIINKINKLK